MTLRIADRVKAGDHDDPGIIDAVVQAVREARQQEAPGAAIDNRVGVGKVENRIYCQFHRIDELATETRPLEVIPITRLRHIGDCRNQEPGAAHADQPRSRCLASAQEMTAALPLSRSSSRRSSSLCCAGVIRSTSGRAQRLSHRSPIKARRSSGASLLMSITGMLMASMIRLRLNQNQTESLLQLTATPQSAWRQTARGPGAVSEAPRSAGGR